jgi:hypothetical protein
MTDKVQKIRQEVEKLKSNLIHGACSSQVAMETRCKEEAYNEVLAILDSMQEETISEVWHDANEEQPEKYRTVVVWNTTTMNGEVLTRCTKVYKGRIWAYIEDALILPNVQRTGKNWKEPVSEELEEASKEWLKPQLDKSYAEYGETKMMELTHFDGYAMLDAIEFGAKWKEKKMMKDAIDVTVHIDSGGYPYIPQIEFYDYDKDVPLTKEGDRYKVILIKEE